MSVVSVVIPTYNEEENIPLIYNRIKKVFMSELKEYQYKILFIDNCSKDQSQKRIKELTEIDEDVQYIFNVKNFGFSRSTFYGLSRSIGDCSILLFADMQDPPELIATFVKEWEKGYKIVAGIKNKSKENRIMYWIRNCYYKFVDKISDVEHIEQFTGFGLYDKSVIKTFYDLTDPLPYLRGIVAELGPECQRIYYEQEKRERGKSSFNFLKLYDVAMLGITSYSNALIRIASFMGAFIALVSFIISIITFVLKITGVVSYPIASAATLFGVFFLGGVQLLFIGVLGEYISNINIRTMNRPLVVEKERKGLKGREEKEYE